MASASFKALLWPSLSSLIGSRRSQSRAHCSRSSRASLHSHLAASKTPDKARPGKELSRSQSFLTEETSLRRDRGNEKLGWFPSPFPCPAQASESVAAAPPSALEEIYSAQETWTWKGHSVNYSALGSSKGQGKESSAVVLIHGFGASIGHWRKMMPLLASDGLVRVYALDLLGLGASDKPDGFPYSIEGWAEMVDDFAAEVVQERQVVFIGNSIGSLVALAAAAGASTDKAGLAGRVKGVVLLNCAGGLNNKAIQDDWRIKLVLPLFLLIDFLLSIPPVANAIFNTVKTRDNVKAALSSVYCNQDAVDDELVELIMKPADDEGALGAFVAVITGPPGPRPEDLIPQIPSPILIMWGDEDPFTPFDGPIGKYFRSLPETREDVSFVVLEDVGHCPQDDREELVHDALLPWLNSLFNYA